MFLINNIIKIRDLNNQNTIIFKAFVHTSKERIKIVDMFQNMPNNHNIELAE